jgi:hypothetical protein
MSAIKEQAKEIVAEFVTAKLSKALRWLRKKVGA